MVRKSLSANNALEILVTESMQLMVMTDKVAGIAKNTLTDTITQCLIGAQSETAQTLQISSQLWGNGECSYIGGAQKTSAVMAALLNGATSNAEDCSAYDNLSLSHSPSSIYAALLALSEHLEKHHHSTVNGAHIMQSFVCGMQGLLWVAKAINPSHYYGGWHTSATLNAIGATLACCHLYRLNQQQSQTALSLCTSRISGYKSQIGSMAKILHAGFAAETGVICATLAKNNAHANTNTFDGQYSLLTLQAGETPIGFEDVFDDPQARIENIDFHYKPYPICAFLHSIIHTIIELMHKYDLALDNLSQCTISMPQKQYQSVAYQYPENEYQARFSLTYCVATVLIHKQINHQHFTATTIKQTQSADSPLHQLMDKIKVDSLHDHHTPITINLTLHNSTTAIKRVIDKKTISLSEKELKQRLLDLPDNIINTSDAQHLLHHIDNLERVESIGELMKYL